MNLKKIDPVLNAEISTNTKKQLTRTKNADMIRWRARKAESSVLGEIDAAWKPAVKAMRQAFRNQFRRSGWDGLLIEFQGQGYSINWALCCVCAYIDYRVTWYGIEMSRHFCPKNLVEVKVEALRLKDALVAWEWDVAEKS